MPLLGHWPELLAVLLIGLLVFGPKRMIEMGSSLGKAVREMRESLKDLPGVDGSGMRSLLHQDEPLRTPFTAAAPVPPSPPPAMTVSEPATTTDPTTTPTATPAPTQPTPATPLASSSTIVEGTVQRVVEVREN